MLLKKRQTSTLKLFSRLTDGWLLPLKFSSLRLSLNTFFSCWCCCYAAAVAVVWTLRPSKLLLLIFVAWKSIMPEIRSPLFSHFPSFSLSFFLSVFGLNVISLCSTLSSHLSCAIIFFLSLSCDQSDQMARLFFHYLAKYNNDILPDSVSF